MDAGVQSVQDTSPRVGEILALIKEQGKVSIAEICRQLDVSESTARRALASLESQRLVRRYHGGASIMRNNFPEVPVLGRQEISVVEKQAIGRAAAAHVRSGDRVILTGGSTVAAICPYLQDTPNVTIITDSLLVVNAMMHEQKNNIIALGGVLNPRELCFEGFITASNMRTLRADTIFIGIKGITEQDGFMTDDIRQVDFYRSFATFADRLIIVACNTKFSQEGITTLFSLAEADLLITDAKAPENITSALVRQGCAVELAQPL